jgi:hypothetical protein
MVRAGRLSSEARDLFESELVDQLPAWPEVVARAAARRAADAERAAVRAAAAIVTAAANDDEASVAAILDEVGVALVLPLVDLLVDLSTLYAERCRVTRQAVLEITGEWAAQHAAGVL